MGFLDFLKSNRKSEELTVFLLGLDFAMLGASPFVEERVKRWNLEDRGLMLTLGYLLGYIDAAYQTTKPARYNEKLVEKLFHEQIAKYLSGVPGVDGYFRLYAIDHRGISIGWMQENPHFMAGARAGAGDFFSFFNDRRQPLSLVRLLQDGAP